MSSAATTARASEQPAEINGTFLFEMVIYDLHRSAQAIGLAIQNVAENSVPGLRHLLHDDSAVMLFALRYGVEMGLTEAQSLKLEELYRKLSGLIRETRASLGAAGACSSASPLAVGWRRVAQLAGECLRMLGPACESRLGRMHSEDGAALILFLEECVRARGRRTPVPTLQQRRAAPRAAAGFACTVETPEGRSVPALVRDISTSGMGLSIRYPLTPHQRIAIVLPDGRRLGARVVTRNGPACGVELSHPLKATDPLLLVARSRENGRASA